MSLQAAAAYRARGLTEGSLVALIARSNPSFTASLFGAFAAGVTACSIAPPFAMQRGDDYARHTTHLLSVAGPHLVVCDEDSAGPVRGPLADLGLAPPVLFDELVSDVEPARPLEPSGTALLQFTSGSMASRRANLDAMRHWLCPGRQPAGHLLAAGKPRHGPGGSGRRLMPSVAAQARAR
jgi:acyl-CoA synthetase (AMP-forming)/AMP-acid ligase II